MLTQRLLPFPEGSNGIYVCQLIGAANIDALPIPEQGTFTESHRLASFGDGFILEGDQVHVVS